MSEVININFLCTNYHVRFYPYYHSLALKVTYYSGFCMHVIACVLTRLRFAVCNVSEM